LELDAYAKLCFRGETRPLAHKQVHLRSEARENILTGAPAIADAVRRSARPQSNAISVASVLLLTEARLTNVPEKKAERASAFDQMAE
jgi:hypothetical protein